MFKKYEKVPIFEDNFALDYNILRHEQNFISKYWLYKSELYFFQLAEVAENIIIIPIYFLRIINFMFLQRGEIICDYIDVLYINSCFIKEKGHCPRISEYIFLNPIFVCLVLSE